MRPVQALRYLKEGCGQPVSGMPEYEGAKRPMNIAERFWRQNIVKAGDKLPPVFISSGNF